MIFSYSQISHFVRCPRSYRYRYLEGWQEKDNRAGMIFGRCFEKAIAASFLGQDCGATLFQEWSVYRDAGLGFKNGENWDRLYHQGIRLLELFARDNRIRIPDPEQNLQKKIHRDLPDGNEFVAYLDAIGERLVWRFTKKTARRKRAEPVSRGRGLEVAKKNGAGKKARISG